MWGLDTLVKKAEIVIPKGKIIMIFPEKIDINYPGIKLIEKQQNVIELGSTNGIPASVSLLSFIGELTYSIRTADEFEIWFNYISNNIILKATSIIVRTSDKNGILVNTKIVSKIIVPMKNFILCRFNSLRLNPDDPNNGEMHQKEIWVGNQVLNDNTTNVGEITDIANDEVRFISPENGYFLFSTSYNNGKLTRKNVSTLMIVSTKLIGQYIFNSIDTTAL
jgi:hypothetical protein